MPEDENAKQEVLLDLAEPRTVVLDGNDRQYTLTCRRILDGDWLAYFGGIYIGSEMEGREFVTMRDSTTPLLALAEAVLIRAAGYTVAGGAELCGLPNWQRRVPMAHRLLLAETLADVRPSSTDNNDLALEAEAEVVSLDATWSWGKGEDGAPAAMRCIMGLRHTLRSPTEEQHRRYAREGSRSRVVGGSRGGRTVYPGANALLARLYDEIVISVDGYSVAGSRLATREQIVREMDLSHKVMAAQEVFAPRRNVRLAEGGVR